MDVWKFVQAIRFSKHKMDVNETKFNSNISPLSRTHVHAKIWKVTELAFVRERYT